MAAYDTLRAAIDNYIKANGNNEITGTVLNDILNAMVSALGADTRFAGVAVPSTNPGNPEGNVVYFASQAGTYSNFGGIVLPLGIHILVWNGTAWTSQTWFSVNSTPTQNSQNLVTSGGIFQAIVDAVGVERLRAIGAEVTSCSFNSTTKKVSFFNSANSTLFQLDATAFIIDGMVSDVKIEDGNLVIKFNTDAGKQDIEIPLTDIFNPANYYTKTAIDTLLALYYTKTETNALLTAINNKLADGCLYKGMAEPTTNPPTPTTKVFYIATKAGTYTNFGNIAVTDGITILKYNGSNWSKEQVSYSDGVFDISAYNGTSYADLSAALGTNGANIPQNLRKGGMSVKFVQSSDNNYVQYRCISNEFSTNPDDWASDEEEIKNIDLTLKKTIDNATTSTTNLLTPAIVLAGKRMINGVISDSPDYDINVYNVNPGDKLKAKFTKRLVGTSHNAISLWKNGSIVTTILYGGESVVVGYEYTFIVDIDCDQVYVQNGEMYEYQRFDTYVNEVINNDLYLDASKDLIQTNILLSKRIVNGIISDTDPVYYVTSYNVEIRDKVKVTFTNNLLNTANNVISLWKNNAIVRTVLYGGSISAGDTYSFIIDVECDQMYIQNGSVVQYLKLKEKIYDLCDENDFLMGNIYSSKKVDVSPVTIYSNHRMDGITFVESEGYACSCFNITRFDKIEIKLSKPVTYNQRSAIVLGNSSEPSNSNALQYVQLAGKEECVAGYIYTFVVPEGFDYMWVLNPTYVKKILTIGQSEAAEYDSVDLPTVYTRKEKASNATININNSLFPEGFIKQSSQHATISDGREFPVNRLNSRVDVSQTITLKVDGYANKQIQVATKMTDPESISGKTAFVLCIGESTTEAHRKKPETNEYDSFWGWPSAMQYFALCDNSAIGDINIHTIGHKGNYDLPFTFKSNNLINRSFHEGYGGRPSVWLLNLPTEMAKINDYETVQLCAPTLWYFLGLATKTPYSQVAMNSNREEYTGSQEQITLITSTPAGKYKVDGSESLWNLVRDNNIGGNRTGITGAYTGSSEQIAALNTWGESLFNNPDNPFYSVTEARTGTSGTAFSLSAYLERYRTMDDAGNRLTGSAGQTVVGGDGNTYTIGTRVSNTSDWDVCTPTHVIFNIGINDSEAPNTVSNFIENVKDMMGLTNVPTGFFVCRYGGVCNKSMWSDVATCQELGQNTFVAEALDQLKTWFDTQTGKYLIPAFQIQTPISSDAEFMEDNPGNSSKRLNVESAIHTSYYGYKSIGLQTLCWLYYTLSLES